MDKAINSMDIRIYEIFGFKRWRNGGHDRLYINAESLGLVVERYKTGNVKSATWQGIKISNADARRLMVSKIYVDVETGELHVYTKFDNYDHPLDEIAQTRVDRIKAHCNKESE